MVLRCPPRSKREGDILPLLQHAFRDAPATWRGATVEGCPANAEARVNRPTRNYAYLVFDTLYGLDTNWMAQPQMVQGHEIAKDGLVWTLKLREGLRFHDKEPVLARDVVASIRRFAPRISFAGALLAATDELSAADDRTVQFRLKRPFPHLPEALAGPGGTVPAIMPERLASESPYKPVAEVVGSGPYRFLPDEHVSGARAAFERFALYRPREDGAVGFTSGPKVAHFERVEWATLDTFSAFAALGRGEIDWWESPPRDLVEQIGRCFFCPLCARACAHGS